MRDREGKVEMLSIHLNRYGLLCDLIFVSEQDNDFILLLGIMQLVPIITSNVTQFPKN